MNTNQSNYDPDGVDDDAETAYHSFVREVAQRLDCNAGLTAIISDDLSPSSIAVPAQLVLVTMDGQHE